MRKVLVTILVFSWIFSGWPQIFNFQPKAERVKAASVVLTGTAADSITESDIVAGGKTIILARFVPIIRTLVFS